MFDRNASVRANQNINKKGGPTSTTATVYHIILDMNDSELTDLEIPDGDKPTYIGAIKYKSQNGSNKATAESIAFPKNLNYSSLPTKNEIVNISSGAGGATYYERIGKSPTPNINAAENTIKTGTATDTSSVNKSNNYGKVSSTGIARSNVESDEVNGYGKYFTANGNLHKLKLYEGDSLIESRFGQSIRFSGYNNPDNSFSPTITIRNIENAVSLKEDNTKSTEEDINRDGSIIILGSNEYQLPFQPGTVSDSGTSDFETSPTAFSNYPSDLKGNQILINSDRLIFSAKTSEMIFYSKKDYGFISDGQLSIDNKLGIEVNVSDDINILTNDKDINLNTNNGKVNIGNVELESLVRGETLLGIMEELIDAIVAQIYLTPSGPSAEGPTNIADFNAIKSRLKEFLSTLNKTS
tara:strand:+ start:7799 stop:9031 length:1233 start_codon:yes stop_codon:yes gene_type:complete